MAYYGHASAAAEADQPPTPSSHRPRQQQQQQQSGALDQGTLENNSISLTLWWILYACTESSQG